MGRPLQRSGHDWFCCTEEKKKKLEEFCQANPPFIVAVKKIANIADLVSWAVQAADTCRNPKIVSPAPKCLVDSAPLWLYKPGSGRQKQR